MGAENKVIESIPVFSPHNARLKIKNPDPAYNYRWVSMTQERIDFMKDIGYEFVTQEDTKTGADNRRIVGTSVLMRCPREQYERREHIRRLRSRQMLESPRNKVKDTAQALGVEAMDSTREYRAPLSQGMADLSDKGEAKEGTVTREQVKQFMNPNKE